MAIPSSLNLFFFLSHLLLTLHLVEGQETCPKEFKCGSLGNMSFPFTDYNKSSCGLCLVDCDKPKPLINLWVEERPPSDWPIVEKHNQSRIQIEVSKSCHVFQNYILPNNEDISYRITTKLTTLLKCELSSFPSKIPPLDLDKFQDCERRHGFTIYYNYSDNTISDYNGDPPPSCSTIHLPLENIIPKDYNLFNYLAEEISIEWNVTKPWPCHSCFSDGQECIVSLDKNSKNVYNCTSNWKESNKKSHLVLGLAISTGVVITILVIMVYFARRQNLAHYWETESDEYRNIEKFLRNYGSVAPKRFKYYEIKRITSSFKIKLGQGGFGSVFKGYLEDKNPVAAKLLSISNGSGEDFVNEVASISNTCHVNVVELLGFCFEYNKRALVYEYMPNGSLEKFIFGGKSAADYQLGWPTLFKIAVGIARGLEYLHRFCAKRMVHFDIKPHNVLLDQEFSPKISDFGLAKLCSEDKSMLSLSGARGTIGYIAPEVVCKNIGGVSHKSDVYSYGMMILEMVGGRKNSDIGCNDSNQMYFPHWIYDQVERNQEIVLPSIMNDAEKETARKMIIVSLWCIQTGPLHRPTMSKVVEMLEGNLDILETPPRPYLFSSGNSYVADSSALH